MLEIRSYAQNLHSLSVALPYRHAEKADGLAIHRPKFFTSPEDQSRVSEYGDAFFRGVAQHEKGSAVWNTHLDDSR